MLPPELKKGDTIGIFSPSSPATSFAKRRYQRGKRFLEEKGYKIKEGILTGKSQGYRSGSIVERVEEFHELLYDPKVTCMMSTIGGYNSNSLLPYLDYDYIRKHPKIFIGYSDVTALLMGIYAKTGVTTYYGPAIVASFGEYPPLVDQTYESFEDVVSQRTRPYSYTMPLTWTDETIPWETQNRKKVEYENQWITINSGKAKGRLIAGNLNTMAYIWNTEYMPKIKKGDLLLVEDSFKNRGEVERSFAMLMCSGVFDRIGGLILGKHEQFDHGGTYQKPYDILKEVIREKNIPILAEVDCCHTHPMFTMPIGEMVELDSKEKRITLL